jgi:PucR family transcriptional regulator, purine catabolism regulatory protein
VQVGTGQRLNAQLQVFGAVQWLAAGNLNTREIFARLERLSGYRLYACTTQRGPLLDGVPVPPPDQAKLIPGTPTSPPTVPGGYVLPASGPRGEKPSAVPLFPSPLRPGRNARRRRAGSLCVTTRDRAHSARHTIDAPT